MKFLKFLVFLLGFQLSVAEANEVIWRGLIEGQSPNEVAELIRKMEGIKKIKVKKAKKKKPASLKIKYLKKGSIEVAGKRVTINPLFEADKLYGVALNVVPEGWASCLSNGLGVQQQLDGLLTQGYTQKEKYSPDLIKDIDQRIYERKIRVIGKNSNDYESLPERLRTLVNHYYNETVSVENILTVSAHTHSAGSAGAGIANISYNLCKKEAGFYGGNLLRYTSNRYQEVLRKQKEETLKSSRGDFREKADEL